MKSAAPKGQSSQEYYRDYSADKPSGQPAAQSSKARDNGWKAEKTHTPFLAQLFRPVVWVARALAWATEPEQSKGRGKIAITGKVLLFSAGMIYSFGMTTEGMLVLLNEGTRDIYGGSNNAEDIRFIPKLGVNDGAAIGRVIPSPLKVARLASNLAFGWVPGYERFSNTQFDNYLVWADPNFYLAVVLALITNILQAKAIRSVSIKNRKARLDSVSGYQVQDLSPKALTIAKIRKTEYQNAMVGDYVFEGVVIVATYVFEISTFLLTFEHQGSNFAFLLINGAIEVFGFEASYKLTGLTDVDEEV